MKKLKLLFVIGMLSILITSCRMPRYCFGFDLQDHKDITFRYNDTLTYYSDNLETKDTLVLHVTGFYYSEPYEFYEISIVPDFKCGPVAYYQTDEVNGISIQEHWDDPRMEVTIGNDNYSFGFPRYYTTVTSVVGTDYAITSSYVIVDQEKLFYWKLDDKTGTRRFDSFTKMEYRGIIEFHDKQTGRVWKLID